MLRPGEHSIATVCLSGPLPEKLEAASRAGFRAVEIFENDLLNHDGTPAEIRQIAADLDIAIVLYQPFRDFDSNPPARLKANLDRAERKFDTMAALGTDMLLVCSNVQPSALNDFDRAAADLRAMAERAAARGFKLAYEALAWGRHVRSWRQAWDIVKRADHPALGLALDSFHTLSLGEDLTGIDAVPAEKIHFVQLADAPRLSMDVLSWSRHFRNFPGQGQLPVDRFLRDVWAAGYRGPLSLEIFNDEFRAAPARRIARDGLRSLVWLDDQADRVKLPPLPRIDGVAFVEFAVDETSRAELAAFIAPLGFRRAGVHRSKEVELWRWGGVHLVLNAEPDSAAAERFAMHGPCVCALGLHVDDPARAVARAEALLSPIWNERIGMGEREIPALRAPDGSLIHLVESPKPDQKTIWETDFVLEPIAEDPNAPTGVDHLAEAVAPGLLDGFVLFWRSIFGLVSDAPIDLPDPYGLVQSRAMSDPGGRFRLALNVSADRQTGTGRIVSAFAGAGVHHVAFAVPDAAAAIDAAANRENILLEIPENYYDDIAARFGIEDADLAALRERHLLYDEDGAGGRFRHAFTHTFDDRFFLELAERQAGYGGYGAPNAGVRLAAQRRERIERG